jgi:ABC-type nitrate/sulfonate/bicarbonate transport system permease component
MASAIRRRAPGLLLLGLLALAWEGASQVRLVDPFFLPSLSKVMARLLAQLADGRLVIAVGSSLLRGFVGYALAASLGVVLGAVAGRHGSLYYLIEPLVELLRPLPAPAILPVAILLLGIDSAMKVFVIAFACFFPILLNTIEGVRGVPPALIETALNLGVGRFRLFTGVLLPAASPAIFTGLRVAISLMLILVVVSEMVAGNSGIGFLILDAERSFRVADMYAYIMTLAALGYLLNRVFIAIDQRVLGWYHRMNRLAPR